MGRVVLGGLLAGLIINISEAILNMRVLGKQMEEAMASHNFPAFSDTMIIWFIIFGFLLGIASVWLYAGIRPRYNPGSKTAIIAGIAVWFFAYFYPGIGFIVMGWFPLNMMLISLVWGFFEVIIAIQAGAWLYKEA